MKNYFWNVKIYNPMEATKYHITGEYTLKEIEAINKSILFFTTSNSHYDGEDEDLYDFQRKFNKELDDAIVFEKKGGIKWSNKVPKKSMNYKYMKELEENEKLKEENEDNLASLNFYTEQCAELKDERKKLKEENLKLLKECDKHRRSCEDLSEIYSQEKIKWANEVLRENKKLKEDNQKLREVKNKRTEKMGKIIYDISKKLEELKED